LVVGGIVPLPGDVADQDAEDTGRDSQQARGLQGCGERSTRSTCFSLRTSSCADPSNLLNLAGSVGKIAEYDPANAHQM
jgi:hypothetical protein